MKRIVAAFLLTACALFSHAKEWRFGNFEVQWADGWAREDSQDVIRLVAPPMIGAGVTIDILDQETPRAKPIGYAKETLPLLAARHGKVVDALKEEALPNGASLFSIASYAPDRNYFGIIFVHVSAKGRLAQMAVEGFGDPQRFMPRYRELARSARWLNEPNQPPQRNAGSRPSSGDSPGSETPSSLGPRG